MKSSTDLLVTTSVAEMENPLLAFDRLIAHLEKDEVPVERVASDQARIRFDNTTLEMNCLAKGLRFHIEAVSTSNLYLWRQGVAEHVAELAPEAAQTMRWSDSIVPTGAPPPNLRIATIVASSELLPGLQRVELALDQPLGEGGIHLRLLIPREGVTPVWPVVAANGALRWPEGKETLHSRAYTIRWLSDDRRRLTLDVVRHAGGRVAEWAETASAGGLVGLLGPGGGNEVIDTDGDLIIAGDMTALPAMARILEALPSTNVRAWAACPSQSAADVYFGEGRVTALSPVNFDTDIIDLLRQQHAPGAVWFAGELQTAKELRAYFRNHWSLPAPRRQAVGYWERN